MNYSNRVDDSDRQRPEQRFTLFARTPTRFVQAGETRLAYQAFEPRGGFDETLLLIVGHGGQLHYWGEQFVKGLVQAGYRVVVFDNRDAGLSEKFDHLGKPDLARMWYHHTCRQPIKPPYTLENMARDAVALLGELNITDAHIIGASMGGMIGQLVAARFPERTLSLTSIMSSSGARKLPDPDRDVLALMQSLKAPRQHDQRQHELRVRFWQAIGSDRHGSDAYFDDLVAYTRARADHPPGVDRQLAAIWASGDRTPLIRSIRVPTHVIHGRDDALFPLAHGAHVADQIGNSELSIIDHMGHAFQPEIIAPLLSAVLRFLERH